jgi:hypothetical protein
MKRIVVFVIFLAIIDAAMAWAQPVPTTIDDFFLPGSQPGQSGQLETPDKCDNCHGGYNLAVEPAYNWRGSMMAQAARDPLFFACLAISNQDAPQSGDLCIRCHSPAGWLEGRSIPTDGSALNNNDRQGVQCDFCHKAIKPSPLGTNPYPNDPGYTSGTYPQDQSYLALLNPIPGWSANGMYIAGASNAKRGPFIDAPARHQLLYSPFHSDANICGTCHDVSNPAFTKDAGGDYQPNNFGQPAPDFDPQSMFPIERTFSEWKYSAYNTPLGVYAPQFGGNKQFVSTCQDCHMKDVTGPGCNKAGAPIRTDLPWHDMTGGNTFIPGLVASLFPAEVNTAALNSGVQRANYMLQNAASMSLAVIELDGQFSLSVRVTNETAHKLPSGYPEGRRIWLNVRAYDTLGVMIYESGVYDNQTALLIHDDEIKVYEIKPGLSQGLAPVVGYPAGPSFHFVLNDTIYSDNRIPPRGFINANFQMIQSAPVAYSYADQQYWDDTQYTLPGSAGTVAVTLYYQTLSKEYVEFLRNENRTNDWGTRLYNLWVSNGMSAPVAMKSQTYIIRQVVDNTPPTSPTNLTARAISSSQIDLLWTASTDNVGVAGYYIYRNGANVGTATTNQYSDTGLQPLTTYSYYVVAFDAAGNVSAPSNTASATTKKRSPRGKLEAERQPALEAWTEPNPFNANTTISYALPDGGHVRLSIYNIMGQKVTDLIDGWQEAGHHQVSWNASNVASGVYFMHMSFEQENVVQKLVLMK